MFPQGSVQGESHHEELHESQNTDGLKNRHSCLHLKLHPHSSAGIGLFWKLDFRGMMLIFGLMLLLLLQTAACLEFNCRFNQTDPCYAALGHKLNLKMVNASKYYLTILKRIKNNHEDQFCRVKNDKIRKLECGFFNDRTEVTVINGTLIINRVIRADSGNYTLRLSHSDGTVTYTDLQVIVEGSTSAAVTSSLTSTLTSSPQTSDHVSSESVVFVLVWSFQLMGLFGLLGGFHIYMRHTSGKKQEEKSEKVRMRRFREGHEHTAEDSGDQQQISSHL